MLFTTSLLFALSTIASAQMLPLTPSGVTAGKETTAQWTKDTTGVWKDVTMTLMTGDNFQMVPLTTLATGIDATTVDSYSFAVPEVTPNSAIYFLQFQPANNASAYQWTTRFLIASADGTPATPPPNDVQPGGASIPWGVGSLLSGQGQGSNSTIDDTDAVSSSTTASSTSSTKSIISSSSSSSSSSTASTTKAPIVLPSSSSSSTNSQSAAAAAAASASASTSAARRTMDVAGLVGTAVITVIGVCSLVV